MKKLLAFSLTSLLAFTASAGRFFAVSPMWSIDFSVAPDVCVTQLRYDWGNLRALNRNDPKDPLDSMTICGGKKGNGIGGYSYESPMPKQPLNISWRTAEGVPHAYALDMQSAFPGKSLVGASLSVRVMGDGVVLAIRDAGAGFIATRTYSHIPSNK